MPHYQGSLAGIERSNAWAREHRQTLYEHRVLGVRTATEAFFGSDADSEGG